MLTKKVRIVDVVSGKFFAGNKDDMKPSYVINSFGDKISRMSLVGTVVDKFESNDGNYATLTVDDGSELVRVKAFKNTDAFKSVDIGDSALVIGKLREYQGEVYVNFEILRKVERNYEIKHKLEVLGDLIKRKNAISALKKMVGSVSDEELASYAQTLGFDEESLKVVTDNSKIDHKPRILELIEKLGGTGGVEVMKIFESLKLPDNIVENALTELLDEGYIYEPKPGVLKKI